MELQVIVTLSDRLFGLLEEKLPNLGRRVEKAITKEIGAQTRRESSISVSVSATPTVEASTGSDEPQPHTRMIAPDLPKASETPTPEAPAQSVTEAPAPSMTPAERIRQIMHRTRQRFEGDDYKENTASENYKKYHKQLTGQFKNIAAILGADKPSTLPDDKIDSFAAECEALIIGDDGNITPPPASF